MHVAGLNLGEKFGELEPLLAKPYSPAQHVAEDPPERHAHRFLDSRRMSHLVGRRCPTKGFDRVLPAGYYGGCLHLIVRFYRAPSQVV